MPTIAVTGGRIPPDIQYYLDGAIECYDIPPDVYFWARTFEPEITRILDNFDSDPELIAIRDHSTRLSSYGDQIEAKYLQWQLTAPFEEVALCLGYGLTWTPDMPKFISDVAHTLVDARHGMMAGVYAEYITHQTDILNFYNGMRMFERKLGFLQSLYRIQQQWDALESQPDFSDYEIVYPPEMSREDARNAIEYEDNHGHIRQRAPRSRPKGPRKETKKALKRSAELLDGITGEKTTSLFLSGGEVVVTGQKYKFVLTKQKYGSITSTHGSAQTKVYDLATDEFICGLCVYTPNVTIFDHLASIVLHCKSGLEEQIILDANITTRGNMALLPESKKLTELAYTRNQEIIDALDGEDQPRDVNRMLRHINGIHYQEIQKQKSYIDNLNNKLRMKTTKRVLRKYAGIVPKRVVRNERLKMLFYGPEVG